ncbi:MAG TPA: RNB domain-containing ribonuclease, partial [Rhizomicrobium sp.]|nr:RNB domain-containing ribonuclease [Rhizomicrobium sp.]
MAKKPNQPPKLDKNRLLALLAENPGATKRDLARLTGLKGSDRILLKRLLKELEAEGAIAGRAKRGSTRHGELPEMTVVEISGTDSDGELMARPVNWESSEEPPLIYVAPPKEGTALAKGARILARLEQRGDHYDAKLVRRLESEAGPERILGVLRETPQGFRVMPVERKARGEYALDRRDAGGAKHNELVLCEALGRRAAGFPRVRVVERIGSMDSPRTISLIAIHAQGIPTVFPEAALGEAKAARPLDPKALAGRTDLRAIPLVTIDPSDARDHDDAVWAGPRDDGGHEILVAIADVAHYVTPGSALDKEALKRGNSAYFPDRVVP